MPEFPSQLIVLTGGGTAGHVMPNLALAPELEKAGFNLAYVGSRGIEEELVKQAGIRFFQIRSGKLRRYFAFANLVDILWVAVGICQSFILMLRLRPACVFSKGGFVAVPVSIGAWLAGIPVVSHESDVSPGLANRIISRFARMNLYAFPETSAYMSGRPSRCVGIPVRSAIFLGQGPKGLELCGWSDSGLESSLPVVLFMGGSLGAKFINEILVSSLAEILEFCRVIHLTGRGKMDVAQLQALPVKVRSRYKSFEFLNRELPDVLAASDLAVCRAGANSIYELLAVKKPMILIPLEKGSRGDQVLNAGSFKKQGFADVLPESEINRDLFVSSIRKAVGSLESLRANLRSDFTRESSIQAIIEELNAAIKVQD